jgi:hypothetical protein
MLDQWLGEARPEVFSRFYLREPYAAPATGSDLIYFATSTILPSILGQIPEPDVWWFEMAVISGRSNLVAFLGFRRCCRLSIVIRNAQKHDCGVRELCDAFAQELDAIIRSTLQAAAERGTKIATHRDVGRRKEVCHANESH